MLNVCYLFFFTPALNLPKSNYKGLRMPLYEYKCQSCGEHTDTLQSACAPPLKQCPYCLNETLVKLFSAPQFTLIGEGFYKQGKHQ